MNHVELFILCELSQLWQNKSSACSARPYRFRSTQLYWRLINVTFPWEHVTASSDISHSPQVAWVSELVCNHTNIWRKAGNKMLLKIFRDLKAGNRIFSYFRRLNGTRNTLKKHNFSTVYKIFDFVFIVWVAENYVPPSNRVQYNLT